METNTKEVITIEALVNAPVEKVWKNWNEPVHIMQWNTASPDWHCPRAENDLRVGGKLTARMEAKDGSMGFDFGGTYDKVDEYKYIEYTLGDGRKVKIAFTTIGGATKVVESFDAEGTHSIEMQRYGWQAILDNFKNYTENN